MLFGKKKSEINLMPSVLDIVNQFQKQTNTSQNEAINYLIQMGFEAFTELSNPKPKKKPRKETAPPEFQKDLDFIEMTMMYKKSSSPEPVSYELRIKEIYRKNDIHYIKAIKKGERAVKSFRVDRIKELWLGDQPIIDPLNFFLEGVISVT
ncbi:MAG: hypothetical protein PQJ58_15060 [Spirochaetales bacterium]|nr:hypothetical protein [Spirochaetales bacterium]